MLPYLGQGCCQDSGLDHLDSHHIVCGKDWSFPELLLYFSDASKRKMSWKQCRHDKQIPQVLDSSEEWVKTERLGVDPATQHCSMQHLSQYQF